MSIQTPAVYPATELDRRLKIVRVPEQAVFAWFQFAAGAPAVIRMPVADLPEGTKVVAVRHDFRTMSFEFLVRHESFDIIREGWTVPDLDPCGINMETVPVRDLAAERAAGMDYHKMLDACLSVRRANEPTLASLADCDGGCHQPECCPPPELSSLTVTVSVDGVTILSGTSVPGGVPEYGIGSVREMLDKAIERNILGTSRLADLVEIEVDLADEDDPTPAKQHPSWPKPGTTYIPAKDQPPGMVIDSSHPNFDQVVGTPLAEAVRGAEERMKGINKIVTISRIEKNDDDPQPTIVETKP